MKGRCIAWSDAELDWIERNSRRPRREAHAEFRELFGRPDVKLSNFVSLCKRKGWMTGRTGRYEPGRTPENKGRKGYCAPGREKGWFRKGERRGVARDLWKPVGTERMSKDGYLERKVNDDLPLQDRWRAVHLILWEELHGPVPDGHCLKCLDGDKTNTDPSNWEAIPRAMLPRLNGRFGRDYDAAPEELKPTLLATAKLEHAVREARKGKETPDA